MLPKIISTFLTLIISIQIGQAQLSDLLITPPYYIKTVKLDNGKQPKSSPIIKLGHRLYFSFVDLQADEKEYSYQIKRYDEYWQPSILNESEFIDGFASDVITDITQSSGTLQSYTHYSLTLPNDNTRILLSGNYMLEVLDEDGEPLFNKPFILYEETVNVGLQVKWANDVSLKDEKQMIDLVLYKSGYTIQNESDNLLIKVFQNNNLNESLQFRQPTFYQGDRWLYHEPQKALFDGINEFRRFECKDLRGFNYGIAHKELSDQLYDFYVYTATPRTHYLYYKDINGCYILAANQAFDDVHTEADYVQVHFTFKGDLPDRQKLYVTGRFNDFNPTEQDALKYNEDTGVYENVQLLKQAYYDYMLVTKDTQGHINPTAIEGNFAQTENDYTAVVYYKAPGARYTKIIGYTTTSSDQMK
jgi:hypothetical protein